MASCLNAENYFGQDICRNIVYTVIKYTLISRRVIQTAVHVNLLAAGVSLPRFRT